MESAERNDEAQEEKQLKRRGGGIGRRARLRTWFPSSGLGVRVSPTVQKKLKVKSLKLRILTFYFIT